jgi:hypothetical protein
MMPSHGNWVGMDLGISWENGNRTGFSPRSHSVELAALQGDRTQDVQSHPHLRTRTNDLLTPVTIRSLRGSVQIWLCPIKADDDK